MYVPVVVNVTRYGAVKSRMVVGCLRSRSVGDMEMIDQHGVKATFTDNGVQLEIVQWADRCLACNDPRLMREGTYKICVTCGCRQ
jgi:hypothetical protein